MKLNRSQFEKDGSGFVRLTPIEPEDMWHIFNLLSEGDELEASTIRKVVTESSTGTTEANRVRTTLMIRIETIDFDTGACMLRVKGRNVKENAFVKLGAYHTLDVELNRPFTLKKQHWDSIHNERLQVACDETQSAEVAAVVMKEGLAFVCLITPAMTIVRAKIDMNIPRKRKGFSSNHDKSMIRFYDTVLRALKTHINFEVVKCVLIASPGFVKDHLFEHLINSPAQGDFKSLLDIRSKFLLVHSSSGFKHSLQEVLQDPVVQAKMSDVKAASEVKCLENFYQMLQTDPSKAFYGLKHVEHACRAQAIESLFISDSLFRCKDFRQRQRYVDLVEAVREAGGEARIFSSLHVSGERLDSLTGVAAVLRFPMPEIEDEDLDSDEDQ